MFAVRPVFWHFIWWMLLAPLLLVELRALDGLRETLALRDAERARSVVAEVTEQRQSGIEHVIRYRFRLAGDPTWYSATDMFGRRDLWVPLEEQRAQQARRARMITVNYLPENPWANEPQGRAGNPVADSVASWLLFLLVDLLWLAETFLIARNYLHCQVAAERQQPARMRFWRSIRT